MKKSILCFVTTAILILLPWSAPAELCEDGHADPADYIVVGARQPTESESGYSGDYYCPVCRTLMVRGWTIDPLPPSAGNGETGQPAVGTGSSQEEGSGEQEDPEKDPVKPDKQEPDKPEPDKPGN